MAETPRPSRLRRWIRRFAALVALVLCSLLLYSCTMRTRLKRSIAETPRDPVTRIALGTEAVTVPAEGAPTTSTAACLLVHGFVSARSDFWRLPEDLAARGVTVRAMRLPGHGTTPVDFAWLPHGALYEAVEAEYRALEAQYDRVYVGGFSMGGSLATLLAANEPGVDGIFLLAPYYKVTYRWWYVLPPRTWNALAGWAVPYVLKTDMWVKLNNEANKGKFFMYRLVPTRGVSQLLRVGKQARAPETLERVACPVLMIHSEGDEAASPEAARAAFERIASTDKELLYLEGPEHDSNHILLWDYDRDEVLGAVLDYVARLEGEAGA